MAAPLNNRALKSVREQRRLDIADVADFTNISPSRLIEFETGDRKPSRKQLEKLSETYGVSLYSLFGDAIPNTPEMLPDFRKRTPRPAVVSPRGFKSLLLSERISHFAKQLILEIGYEIPDWAAGAERVPLNRSGANILRAQFDQWYAACGHALELTGPREQRVLAALRLFFEVQGGVVNINAAPPDDYLGYFLEPDGGVPTIFINRSISSKKAQLFTLAHEYAHAQQRTPGISNPFVLRNESERACNSFAAEFLAPRKEFSDLAENVSRSDRRDVFRYVAIVADQSLLSKHATAIRLHQTDYITDEDISRFEAAWRQYAAEEKEEDDYDSSNFGVPHAKRLSEIGYLPVYLASEGVKRGLIDSLDVQTAIGLSEGLQERAFDLAKRRIEASARRIRSAAR